MVLSSDKISIRYHHWQELPQLMIMDLNPDALVMTVVKADERFPAEKMAEFYSKLEELSQHCNLNPNTMLPLFIEYGLKNRSENA